MVFEFLQFYISLDDFNLEILMNVDRSSYSEPLLTDDLAV